MTTGRGKGKKQNLKRGRSGEGLDTLLTRNDLAGNEERNDLGTAHTRGGVQNSEDRREGRVNFSRGLGGAVAL